MPAPVANFSHKPVTGTNQIEFQNLSQNGVDTYLWDFGDGNTSAVENPTHDYTKDGFFMVSLTVTNGDGNSEVSFPVGVRAGGQVLSQSIYTLVLQYIPQNITYSPAELRGLIEKWQLHLQPLVTNEIAYAEVYNEFAWEPLENQLIAALAAYDIIIQSANAYIASIGNGGTTTNRQIKKITTGPTDVEWFPDSETGDAYKDIFKPGGAFEEIKNSICTLAARERIYLPGICDQYNQVLAPVVGKCPPTDPYDSLLS